MNPLSVDIKDLLEAEASSLGLTFGSNLHIGREPSSPPDCTTLFDYAEGEPETHIDRRRYDHPSLQVRVRSRSYVEGWQLIRSIADALHGQAGFEQGGSLYILVRLLSGPAWLDWDDNGRARFIVNFSAKRIKKED